jgi:6,7-dimethyl-8-ribityllumazine synthase
MSVHTGYSTDNGLSARHLRIGIVTARFNAKITSRLEAGACEELLRLGASETEIVRVQVPGAFEIPLAAKALLQSGCDGVVALGAVIRGETTHYDYVCAAVERGCSQTQLELGKPIGFGVLTTENEEQALDRVGGKHGNKGAEAAQVTVEMIRLLQGIRGE